MLSGLVLALLVRGPSILADSEPPDGHRQDSLQQQQRGGEEVFELACASCHGTGFYGAPVIGDFYAWEDRLPKGEQALLKSTIEGLNSMPARGGCANCSDADIQAAVHYLITN